MRLSRNSHPWMHYDLADPKVVAAAIGQQLGLSDDLLRLTSQAAELYAIGLLGVPVGVLQQSSPLSMDDRELIEAADNHSYAIVQHADPELAKILVASHEFFNGSGYPNGLVGTGIPLPARILSVAGSFSAMTSNRPHRSPFSASEAVAQLQAHSGSRYDPACVHALIEILPAIIPAKLLPPRDHAGGAGGVR